MVSAITYKEQLSAGNIGNDVKKYIDVISN